MSDLIDAHLAHLKAGPYARTTIEQRGRLLRRVDLDLPFGIDGASVEELTDWLARDDWSPAAKHHYYHHIRGYFRWACDERNPHLDFDPSASLPKPKVPPGVPHPCTDDELELTLTEFPQPWNLAVLLAAYAGLRCCELATIRREHICERDIVVKGKGGKTRRIPTMPHVWAAVRDLPRGPLGPHSDAQRISKDGSRRLRNLGLRDGVTMHAFRHWFATTMLLNGRDLLTVSKLLGHANVATTAVYCLITDEQRQIAVSALPVLGAPASA